MKIKSQAPRCMSCNAIARLTNGAEIYPRHRKLAAKNFWRCDTSGCDSHCGCHPGTKRSLGNPAGPELRRARSFVHARLDPLWKDARIRDARSIAYQWLAERLNISPVECHIATFDIDRCRMAYRVLSVVSFDEMKNWWISIPFEARRRAS